MKRSVLVVLPLLITSCTSASHYMQQGCANKYEEFAQVFACTKNKLYNEPMGISLHSDASENAEIAAYGEDLNSQLRQGIITNAQAKELFAKKLAEVQARHEPAPLPLQQGMH